MEGGREGAREGVVVDDEEKEWKAQVTAFLRVASGKKKGGEGGREGGQEGGGGLLDGIWGGGGREGGKEGGVVGPSTVWGPAGGSTFF
jgi:hypothetical protein